MSFGWQVILDDQDITPLVLDGESKIRFGRRSVTDPAAPIYGTLKILSSDVNASLDANYPQFGIGPAGQWEDIYVDEYSGAGSRITLGSSAIVNVANETGWIDEYVDEYATGAGHRRLTGYVSAIEYDAPYTLTLTIASKWEELTRYQLPGPYPRELASERMLTLGADQVDYGDDYIVIETEARQTAWEAMTTVAQSTGGLLYCDTENVIHYREAGSYTPQEMTCPDCAVLIGSFTMTTNLGSVQNTAVVTYGDPRSTVEASNTDSVTTYGTREARVDSILSEQADAQVVANNAVALAEEPGWALPDVEIVMNQLTQEQQNEIAAMGLDDILNVGPLLPGAPQQNVTARVLGYDETISANNWIVTFHLAPENQMAAAVRSQ